MSYIVEPRTSSNDAPFNLPLHRVDDVALHLRREVGQPLLCVDECVQMPLLHASVVRN